MRTSGWRDGLFAYSPPQWPRTFTFGMFYAFNLQLQESAIAMPWAAGLQETIQDYGQYVVLAALVVETGLLLADRIGTRPLHRKAEGEPS